MIRTAVARSLVVAALVAAGFGAAGTAFAEPDTDGDSSGPGACPVVDSDDSGNESTTYVPNGTRLKGLTCQDGTWVYGRSVSGAAAVTIPAAAASLG